MFSLLALVFWFVQAIRMIMDSVSIQPFDNHCVLASECEREMETVSAKNTTHITLAINL